MKRSSNIRTEVRKRQLIATAIDLKEGERERENRGENEKRETGKQIQQGERG